MAIEDRDPPSAPSAADGAQRPVGPPSPRPERLRIDLRAGGKLEITGLPPSPAAGGIVWQHEELRPDGSRPAEGMRLDRFAPPDRLRRSGMLEGSGAAVEVGAADLRLPAWHGLSGTWRVDVDTRLRATLAFDEPLAAALGADYGLSLPLAACYGPLSFETELLGVTWRSDQELDLRWPPDTVRLVLKPPDPLAAIGFGDAFTLSAEAEQAFGAEADPLAVRGQLAWEPWRDEAADRFRPRVELNLRAGEEAAWEPDLGLRARLAVGRRQLTPGRHLQIALEYTHENLLHDLRTDECLPPDQVAAVRLTYR